jgi:hypothetical protein
MAAPQLTNPHARPHTREALNYRFENRYPALGDLLHYGGVPGVRYALVAAERLGHYQSLGWDIVARLPAITIAITDGIHAGEYAAMLMCNGRPIAGAPLDGSVRPYAADTYLDERTGLAPASSKPPAALKPAPSLPKERT